MPNRDTFCVTVTVRDDYEDEPETLLSVEEYLATGQRTGETVAALLRAAALTQNPERGGVRSVEAIYDALDRLRAAAMSRRMPTLMVAVLWEVAKALDVEWYGHKAAASLDGPSVKASGGEGAALGGSAGTTPDAALRSERDELRDALVPFACIGLGTAVAIGLYDEYMTARRLLGMEQTADGHSSEKTQREA